MSSEAARAAVAGTASGEAPARKPETVVALIEKTKPQLARALPKGMDPDRLARIILTEVRKNRELELCTSVSLLGACLTAAQLGLEPGPTQHCYLIPRWNKRLGAKEVQLLIGYRGIVDLAIRGGRTLSVDAHVVRDGDDFEFAYGTEPFLRHVPKLTDRGEPTAAYAVARLAHGGAPFVVLSPDEIAARQARSEAPAASSPWTSDPDSMWRKSCVRALAPYLPQTPEFAQAQLVDGTVRTDITLDLDEYEPPDDVIDVDGHEDDDSGGAPEGDEDGAGAPPDPPPPASGSVKKAPPPKKDPK